MPYKVFFLLKRTVSEVFLYLPKPLSSKILPPNAITLFTDNNFKDANGNTKKDSDGNEITNYSQYNGSFNDYLIAMVTNDYSEVKNKKEAEQALVAWAQEKVAPVLKFSFIADKYNQEYTDEEFDAYKDDVDNNYEANEYYYGESAVRNGLQFEKLMNYFLKSEEKVEGKVITNVYENITVTVNTDK